MRKLIALILSIVCLTGVTALAAEKAAEPVTFVGPYGLTSA